MGKMIPRRPRQSQKARLATTRLQPRWKNNQAVGQEETSLQHPPKHPPNRKSRAIFPQDLPYSIVTAVEFNHQVRDGLVLFLYA